MTSSIPATSSVIDIDRILRILPHRWPFVLVDRVTEVMPHERIRGHKCVAMNEPWFQGHFPGRPIIPGDKLELEVTVIHPRTNVWKLKGEALVEGSLCAEGELLASVVDRAD